jgi:CBS domain containing-hemolysin-like protein
MFALAQTSGTDALAVVAGIVILLLISAFFSSSEIALFSIDDLFVASLADDGAGDGGSPHSAGSGRIPTACW